MRGHSKGAGRVVVGIRGYRILTSLVYWPVTRVGIYSGHIVGSCSDAKSILPVSD